ncbi:MAG: hypothetical protein ACOYBS_05130 [Flavobacterium sp.]
MTKDENGEPIINDEMYTFKKKMSGNDFNIIDTTSLYIQIFEFKNSNETERNNPKILKFHSDGYFKTDSKLFYGKFDTQRHKNSSYYGGKFYIDESKLYLEQFYPSRGDKTNNYVKEISNGNIKNDTITLIMFGNNEKYVKKRYEDIFKK